MSTGTFFGCQLQLTMVPKELIFYKGLHYIQQKTHGKQRRIWVPVTNWLQILKVLLYKIGALAFNLLQRISIMFNKWPMGTSNKLKTFWMYSSLVQGNVHLPLDWLIGCCSNNTFLRIFQSCGNIPIADENLAIATFDSWSIRSLISNIVHWLYLYVSVIYLPWVHDLSCCDTVPRSFESPLKDKLLIHHLSL